jgi:membrane-associated protease RseP (regulator of RpoE activity)
LQLVSAAAYIELAMPTLVDCPQSRQGECSFHLFGTPIRIKLWFWIAALMLGAQDNPVALLIWIAVCFVSILLHEFGHVLAFRLFGTDAEVVLYGWGGLAVPYRDIRNTSARLVIALSGPAAGFCLAALTLAVARAAGFSIHLSFYQLLPHIAVLPARATSSLYVYLLLNDLLFINFYWGLVNLLPVYPLDGGHAARAIFEQRDPHYGRRKSLLLSAAVAAIVAVAAIFTHDLWRVLVFGVLAVSSAQALESLRSPRPYRSTR